MEQNVQHLTLKVGEVIGATSALQQRVTLLETDVKERLTRMEAKQDDYAAMVQVKLTDMTERFAKSEGEKTNNRLWLGLFSAIGGGSLVGLINFFLSFFKGHV